MKNITILLTLTMVIILICITLYPKFSFGPVKIAANGISYFLTLDSRVRNLPIADPVPESIQYEFTNAQGTVPELHELSYISKQSTTELTKLYSDYFENLKFQPESPDVYSLNYNKAWESFTAKFDDTDSGDQVRVVIVLWIK